MESIFGSQTLDHLIGFFAPLRKDHLKPKPMFTPFRAPALLPPVADHGHRMGFSLTVGSQITQQALARHLGIQAHSAADPARLRQEIVPIHDHMECHGPAPPLDALTVDQLRIRSYANPLDYGAYI